MLNPRPAGEPEARGAPTLIRDLWRPAVRRGTMSHRLYEPPMIAWGRTGARVRVSLSSTRGELGSRRWSVRMSHGAEHYDLPLGFATPAGLDPLVQTRRAVLSCAGRLLAELGAIPTDAAGAPIGEDQEAGGAVEAVGAAGTPLLIMPAPKVETRVRSFPLLGAR